jgi:4-hydroxybenzoate polyprenyltransferase
MSIAFQGHQVPVIAARGAGLAKAGAMAGLAKVVLFAVPAVLVGAAVGYGLSKAFDVRWDELSRRAADGESTMGRPRLSGK